MINYKDPIIVIAGPTASGKSDIAIRLAKEINGYIINADSRQIYKDLSIGTAKPIPDEIKDNHWIIDNVQHYLYDFVNPKETFTLYDYQKEVQKVLDLKQSSKQIPILVGGTGLYIDSIVYNYDLKQNEKDIDNSLMDLDLEQLQQKAIDFKESLNNSDWNNKYRLIRILQRGSINHKKGEPLKHKYFVIDIEKKILSERISQRIDIMFEKGLEEENKQLLEKGYTYTDKALNSIGYKEFEGYFNNDKRLESVKKEIYNHTLQYAKRQRTWFKRNTDVIWTNDYNLVITESLKFISTL